MSEDNPTSAPKWVWLVIGGLVAALIFVITQKNEQQPVADTTELTTHLKEVNKRLKTLETQAREARIVKERPADERPALAQNDRRDGQVTAIKNSGQAAVIRGAEARNPKNDNSATAWNPPAFDDGHVFDDGVTVNMNPSVPAAKDPIPASAQVSQDDAVEMKGAFPQGCPTCE